MKRLIHLHHRKLVVRVCKHDLQKHALNGLHAGYSLLWKPSELADY